MITNEINPLDIGPSPLLETDPASVDTLINQRLHTIMNTSPSKWNDSDKDLELVVEYYTNLRLKFLKDEGEKLNQPRTRKANVTKEKANKQTVTELLAQTDLEF